MRIKYYILIVLALMQFNLIITLNAQTKYQNLADANGNKIGKWIFFLDKDLAVTDDSVSYHFYKVVNFVSGRPIGYVNYYYKTGKLYFQTPLKSINPDVYTDGEIKYFAENGDKLMELNYQNGQLNGHASYYFPDGKLQTIGNYTDGIKSGVWKLWDQAGNYGIGTYFNDKQHGKWTFYDVNGNIKSEGKFHNGIQSGIWSEYRESGEIAEGSYVNGLPDGTWVCQYKNQKPCFIGGYKKGIKEGFWKEWDMLGRLSQGNYTNNQRDGIWTLFDASGNKIMEGMYANGLEDGQWNTFDLIGNIIETKTFIKGQKVEQ
jgi:antitoxin component YwqK of YwqJK toxin-antitoxin module